MNTEQKIIKDKVGLLKLAETLGNVSQSDGPQPIQFYGFKELYEIGEEAAL